MPTKVFLSYAQEDAALRDELLKHLAVGRRVGDIEIFDQHAIVPGDHIEITCQTALANTDIALVLISPSYLASDTCWRLMESAVHQFIERDLIVVPVIARAVDWRDAPIGKFQALPANGLPVMSWQNHDEAWLEVTVGLRRAVAEFNGVHFQDTASEPVSLLADLSALFEQAKTICRRHILNNHIVLTPAGSIDNWKIQRKGFVLLLRSWRVALSEGNDASFLPVGA